MVSVSVIMPVYNAESFLHDSIYSILNQTMRDFEFIIIDDASSDRSVDIVKGINDPRIKLIVKPVNSGYTDSLNMSLEIATGKYVARMDADDISEAQRLEKQVRFMDSNPEVAVCGTWTELIPSKVIARYPTDHDSLKVALLEYCPMAHPSVMIRRNFLSTHGLTYDKAYEPSEDYDLWTKICGRGDLANIGETLLKYREHTAQISVAKYATQKMNADRCRVRMLCSVVEAPSIHDETFAEMVYHVRPLKSSGNLLMVFDWLDNLISVNSGTHYFDSFKFEGFINKRKADILHRFFLMRVEYSPATLVDFFSLKKRVREHVTFNDLMKLFVKCILFRRISVKRRVEI
jgi:glycosyltransferase involved in cell wall biosynthesis